ncbi:MAG: enamine deaminase RidA (YjgF/YER057c/UK114 family) [Maricaulis maris]|jgi:enamine deaminase RidA (YjgF/YER057c/UK114 family)|uniref:Endoribonuclease L-PSP n=1 Tax=Maricaulis maris (strain MCS10) TaxID=394221 RepID=Q0AL68_MARMM|nr:RidA family protein [Maricaulis maris]ABI66975.1 Endoribonuclease L-PSP [Maricaulis maris MCS10]
MERLQPPGWPRPKGYSNGIAATGKMVFVAGQIGWDETETIVSDDFAAQFRQVLVNTLAVLKEGGAGPEHVVRMTGYVSDRDEYLAAGPQLGAIWKELMGRNYPVMAFLVVGGLIETRAKIEIETTAVIPS